MTLTSITRHVATVGDLTLYATVVPNYAQLSPANRPNNAPLEWSREDGSPHRLKGKWSIPVASPIANEETVELLVKHNGDLQRLAEHFGELYDAIEVHIDKCTTERGQQAVTNWFLDLGMKRKKALRLAGLWAYGLIEIKSDTTPDNVVWEKRQAWPRPYWSSTDWWQFPRTPDKWMEETAPVRQLGYLYAMHLEHELEWIYEYHGVQSWQVTKLHLSLRDEGVEFLSGKVAESLAFKAESLHDFEAQASLLFAKAPAIAKEWLEAQGKHAATVIANNQKILHASNMLLEYAYLEGGLPPVNQQPLPFEGSL